MDKIYRLRKNALIDEVIKKRKQKNNSEFIICFADNQEENSKICISVSKKLGIAVVRNKIRRQVREMVRLNFDLTIKKDYVIIVRKPFLNNDYAENLTKLQELYLKINPSQE